MVGKNYYKILGLSENASKKEVKKRYKKLVKKCHPDLNPDPKAHEEFILITEAYDFLMESERAVNKSSKSKNSKFEAYRERSREIFEKKQKRKKEEIEQFYKSLRTGWRRNLIWTNAIIGAVFFLTMTADRYLQPRFKIIQVVNISPNTHHSIGGHQVQEVTCSNGESYFLADFIGIKSLNYHSELVLKESRLLHHPISVTLGYRHLVRHAEIHFTLYWAYAVVSLFLFLPWIVLLYRKNNAGFVFLHYTSLILTLPLVLYILFTGDHIIHIFTLGKL